MKEVPGKYISRIRSEMVEEVLYLRIFGRCLEVLSEEPGHRDTLTKAALSRLARSCSAVEPHSVKLNLRNG